MGKKRLKVYADTNNYFTKNSMKKDIGIAGVFHYCSRWGRFRWHEFTLATLNVKPLLITLSN